MAETKLECVSRKFEVETNIKFKKFRRSFSNEPAVWLPNTGDEKVWRTQLRWQL